MPLSVWLGLEDSVRTIVDCRPRSVLDAGIGFGLFGHLLRQYLDVWEGRIRREDWRIRIDGIEIDERRVQPHSRYLYNEVFVGDIRDLVSQCAARSPYNVIMFGDVLEHLPKSDAGLLMRQSVAHAQKIVLIRIPLGGGSRKEGREEPIIIGRHGPWPISTNARARSGNTTTLATRTHWSRSTRPQHAR